MSQRGGPVTQAPHPLTPLLGSLPIRVSEPEGTSEESSLHRVRDEGFFRLGVHSPEVVPLCFGARSFVPPRPHP